MSENLPEYETILVNREGRVATITLNRPKALNALNNTVMDELVDAAQAFDTDRTIGAIIITGSQRAFAAGADIVQMQQQSYQDMFLSDWFSRWDSLSAVRTPMIAAVSGFALGGGCELAMMCDLVIAAESAKFGQPEINLGVIPGIGGSQRLTRAIGKAKAMDLILTGRTIDAAEADRTGLVSRVVPTEDIINAANEVAELIASKSLPAVYTAKEAVNRAFETSLAEGITFERRLFHATFALDDRTEGMTAFIEKRAPEFTHR